MKNIPLITVITVCFNNKSTIKRTLSSVRDQTWLYKEHIIIDGASNDGTLEILSENSSSECIVFSGPDNGIYDAMNKGLRQANGDIICFLNGDDYFSEDTILEFVARQMIVSNLDVLFGDVIYFDPAKKDKVVRHYSSRGFKKSLLSYGIIPAHPATFTTKRMIELTGYFDARYKIAGDFDYLSRLFSFPCLKYKYFPRVFVNMQAGGVSNRGIKSALVINREILASCKSNNIKTNYAKVMLRYLLKAGQLKF